MKDSPKHPDIKFRSYANALGTLQVAVYPTDVWSRELDKVSLNWEPWECLVPNKETWEWFVMWNPEGLRIFVDPSVDLAMFKRKGEAHWSLLWPIFNE